MGFKPLHFDPCVFIYFNGTTRTIIVVYVDDLTIVGVRKELDALVTKLQSQFTVTIKSPLHWLLGFEFQQSGGSTPGTSGSTSGSIKLKQQLYIDQLLERFNMGNLNPVSTLLDSKVKLVKALPDEPAIDTNLY